MYYEINVSKNGKHFFATAKRSITDKDRLKVVHDIFVEKFPKSEGYELSIYYYEGNSIGIDPDNLLPFVSCNV